MDAAKSNQVRSLHVPTQGIQRRPMLLYLQASVAVRGRGCMGLPQYTGSVRAAGNRED